MTKLRIVDGIPEMEGNTDEIVAILQKMGMDSRTAPPKQDDMKSKKSALDLNKIPDEKQIAEMLEQGGRPISFSIAELAIRLFGRYVSTRDGDREFYTKYYNTCRAAMRLLERKYGGKWRSDIVTVDGHPGNKKFTLIEKPNDEPKEESTSMTLMETLTDKPLQ